MSSLKCSWHIIAILRSNEEENNSAKLFLNSAFLNKVQVAGRLKKRLKQQCCLRTLPEDCSKVFLHLFWQFFTRIPEIIVNFREELTFLIIGLFLLFMCAFYIMEPRQVDEPSNRTKRRYQVSMQAWTLRKL